MSNVHVRYHTEKIQNKIAIIVKPSVVVGYFTMRLLGYFEYEAKPVTLIPETILPSCEKKAEISELASEYIANVRNLASEERVQHLKKIENAYTKCKEYSDDKVQLAMQIYEMVDKHIRRLDADLARFENDLQEKLDSGSLDSSDEKQSRKDKNIKDKKGSIGRDKKGSDPDSPKLKRQKTGSNVSESLLAMHPSDVLDMPVDPNEPTYCLCSQVSYGEMIGCDNSDLFWVFLHEVAAVSWYKSEL
ncbi:Inhibitor of growth protein 5 [Anabarilius grahami]|uniref:Inhibitor of growth protein 5 n=1 Tax=Anabarilius grahami TaxID=495550 RepID=A0A3N0YEI7_ANAGA|nr:Inhibitor of growth protein 5 [Anabarilius grahami]